MKSSSAMPLSHVQSPRGRAIGLCAAIITYFTFFGCASDSGLAQPPHSADTQGSPSTAIAPLVDAASGWPRWRGVTGQGNLPEGAVPSELPQDAFHIVWSKSLGTGWSSPVVSEGIVIISDRADNTERLLAFAAEDGALAWKRTRAVAFDPHPVGRRHGNGPKSTPAIDQGRVYNLGIAGWLACCDLHSGDVVWQIDLPQTYGRREQLAGSNSFVNGTTNVIVPIGDGLGAPVPLFGYTSSPVVVDDLLVTMVGGALGGTVMAFDKRTGKEVWRSLAVNVSYSSPIVAEVAGRRQIVVMTGPRVVGLDPGNGELLWSHPFQIQFDESISTPLAVDDLVLVTASGRPLTALRIAGNDHGLTCDVAWTNDDLSSYLSSMVVHDGYVYGMNDGGELVCVALADGKTIWLAGSHGYYCSPVIVGGRIFGLNEQGTFREFAASPAAYELRSTWQVTEEATWTMPAVVQGRLFIRSASKLTCFSLGR